VRTGAYSRPYRGLTVCGDSFVIEQANGSLLTAVIDGLGHGYESSVAAVRAVEVIRQHAHLSVEAMLRRCHEELRVTRGAAVGILKLQADGTGEFCGVGNIEVASLNGRSPSVFCLAGIVGHNLRASRVMPVAMQPGDIYCLMSDGVSTRGNFRTCLPGSPDEVARRIVEQWGQAHDDATALVVGYQADEMLAEPPAASAPAAGRRQR
jgi:phosphoserine phosphatase RsbX